jgi:tetratricopeptide (TPR) repeat protein
MSKETKQRLPDAARCATGLALVLACVAVLVACEPSARTLYQQGMRHLQAQEYGPALAKFEESLAAEPSKMALFGKGRALFELARYDEALPVFEQFLVDTDRKRAAYSDERSDSEFYRDRCKQELGIEVPQDESAIPPPRMSE